MRNGKSPSGDGAEFARPYVPVLDDEVVEHVEHTEGTQVPLVVAIRTADVRQEIVSSCEIEQDPASIVMEAARLWGYR